MLKRLALGGVVAVPVAGLVAYDRASPGLKRSMSFWRCLTPPLAEYTYLVKLGSIIHGDDGQKERLEEFHRRTAGDAMRIILELGGIYVKLGQLVSTLGAGIFDDTYIKALAPLQDGVPPRSSGEVAAIIERSTGRTMGQLFACFEPLPVGAASIAQAHRASLVDGATRSAAFEITFMCCSLALSVLLSVRMPVRVASSRHRGHRQGAVSRGGGALRGGLRQPRGARGVALPRPRLRGAQHDCARDVGGPTQSNMSSIVASLHRC